jgi:capsular exopolysaccharide synthesis family protein
VVSLRAQQEQLSGQLQSLLSRLGPNHPDVVALRNQLADVQRAVGAETARVAAASEADVRTNRARVASLETALRDSQTQVDADAQAQVPLNAMQREADASRTLLQAVLESMQQTAQQAAIEKPDARVISAAVQPGSPSFPRIVPLLAAACGFGLFFGLLLVYLLELTDRTFRSGDDVRDVLGMPCFALVPQLGARELGRSRVEDYVAHKPFSPFAEQMRALYAGIWLGSERPRAIAVTAARPAEGKTTVALSLARAIASTGESVVLLDCDVRQPEIGRLINEPEAKGLVDCLQGRADLAAVIRRDPLSKLDIVPAGAVDAGSLGLFMSDELQALLGELRERYRLVLLDAPPALAMADARIVAHLADATLLCVRWRDTPLGVVRRSFDLLEDAHATVVGAVLTRVDPRVHLRSGFADAEIYHPRYGGYFK